MAKIIEYLAADKIPFTVDTSQVAALSGSGVATLRNGNGKGNFVKGDSFILISYGVILPENFTFFASLGFGLPGMAVYGQRLSAAVNFALPCFLSSLPASTLQRLMEENREQEINGFCNFKDFIDTLGAAVNEDYFLLSSLPNPIAISMLNVPAAANGGTYYISPFVKVAHNLPLY